MKSIVRERDRTARKRVLQFLGLAVLLHLAAAPMLSDLIPRPGPKRFLPVRMVALGKHKSAPQKQLRRRRPEVEEEKEEKPKEEKVEGRVVDLPPSKDDTPPEDAEYLSEHNTRTERETRSRHQSPDYLNPMNEKTVARRAEPQAPRAERRPQAIDIGPELRPDRTQQQRESGPDATFELPDIKRRSRLALKLDPDLGRFNNQTESQEIRGRGKRLKLSLGGEGEQKQERAMAPEHGPSMADLVPEVGVLARLSGGPANDFLDLEEGEGTFLNSREFKFASFFNRMKRGVSQHWRPLAEYRRRDPSGNIYGYKSRVTVLNVILNRDGSLKGLRVARSSGVDFLDREAVAAFRRAEPFPNPPKGLVNDSGEISFPFGFHLDFSSRGRLRLPF